MIKLKIVFVLLLSCFLIQPTFSQKANNKKIKITGSVVDANNKPVEGVLILVDGVKTDMMTNSNGIYSVRVLPAAKTITAFSLFNGVKEMPINGQTTVNIVLEGVSTKTSEPVSNESNVVDVGYGTAKKDQVVNSVTSVDRTKANQRSYTSIYDMIASEVPGAQVNGKSVKLQQGPGSFYSSTEPLYILDGVPVTQIDNINPSDVASIEVLKGPSASIYGTRGANGVLVITSKK
jgi:TonB-dependent SusC/RagA subfamily outer membrane receptor